MVLQRLLRPPSQLLHMRRKGSRSSGEHTFAAVRAGWCEWITHLLLCIYIYIYIFFNVQDVFKCSAGTCGKFYHLECLKADPGSIIVPPKIHALSKEVKVVVPSLLPTPSDEAQQHSRVDADPTGSSRNKASRSSCDDQLYRGGATTPHSPSSIMASSQSSMIEKTMKTKKATSSTTTTSSMMTKAYRCTAQSPYEIQKRKVDSWSFKCPLHYCFNCYEFHGCCDTADLTPCIHCPRAYHTKCIPPGSRFNSMCLLCPRYTYPTLLIERGPPSVQERTLIPHPSYSYL